MARRKALLHTQRQDANSSHPSTSTRSQLSAREYYNTRYEKVDKCHRSTTLYADVTSSHIVRLEGLWREYCDTVDIDPYYTLKRSMEGRIKNFFHWMCNNYSIKKISSVETYWHQLSQLYIKWKGRRISPLTLKQIYNGNQGPRVCSYTRVTLGQFINGPLAEEHRLDDSETDKPLLDAVDFVELLRCHWVTDTNTFPHERQRVQLATILLVAAFTGSRPGALLGITYRDLDLFVQRDKTTGEVALTLQLKLTRTKSRKKRKRPKTYTFFIDTNPVFCIISHIIGLACDDDAYLFPNTNPKTVLTLGVLKGLNCQPIPWKEDILDVPLFRAPVQSSRGCAIAADTALPYDKYHEWIKRLGEETGFVQVFTTYCLRRATGNAVNDDPNSNEAVRNLVMDHTNSAIFQRNYLSRMIRYDTQAAYGGTAPRTELIQAANRMSRRIDPRRPKELTEAQSASIRQEEEIQELRGRRDELFQRIRQQFTFIYRAEGQAIYDQYEEAKRAVDRKIKARERELIMEIQKEYDTIAPVQDMRAQLEGDVELLSPILCTSARVRYAFEERSRIAKAFFDPLSTCGAEDDMDWRVSIVDDMVSLCLRQEGVFRKARRTRRIQARERDPDNDAERPLNAVKSESESDSSISHLFPVRCKPYQCLYCLGDTDLPLEERLHNLGSKYSLQRHFDRRHPFRPREPCPFPHPECAAVTLDTVMHFKNHAATVHGVYMSDRI